MTLDSEDINSLNLNHFTDPSGTLRPLGRPQDPKGFASCSTWGDPKTALAHRTGSQNFPNLEAHLLFNPMWLQVAPIFETQVWVLPRLDLEGELPIFHDNQSP